MIFKFIYNIIVNLKVRLIKLKTVHLFTLKIMFNLYDRIEENNFFDKSCLYLYRNTLSTIKYTNCIFFVVVVRYYKIY